MILNYTLLKHSDCYVLISEAEYLNSDWVATDNKIYVAPVGFTDGVHKIEACSSKLKGIPMINENYLRIPQHLSKQRKWKVEVVLGSNDKIKVDSGFISIFKVLE